MIYVVTAYTEVVFTSLLPWVTCENGQYVYIFAQSILLNLVKTSELIVRHHSAIYIQTKGVGSCCPLPHRSSGKSSYVIIFQTLPLYVSALRQAEQWATTTPRVHEYFYTFGLRLLSITEQLSSQWDRVGNSSLLLAALPTNRTFYHIISYCPLDTLR